MPYTPDPSNFAQPDTNTVDALTAAAEFRSLKPYATGVPIDAVAGNIGFVLTDIGRAKLKQAAEVGVTTWTLPDNATIPLPIGSCISGILLPGCGPVNLAIAGTDTLFLFGSGVTGARSVAAGGEFTAWKVTATVWGVLGSGVS